MMTGIETLLLLAGLAVVMALAYAGPRVPAVLTGSQPADAWTRGNAPVGPGLLTRLQHAHYNLLETLPVFAVVVLVAAVTDRSGLIDGLAPYILFARLIQIAVHLIGTSFPLVLVRATAFVVQMVLLLIMLSKLI
ncbi:MAG: hypothetical protein CMK02_08330 [Polycyclovorans sp.]|jgi:uncharacterized MAPEG superfamily protein|nr:hypothetical protein [Polycyclovorans sp.]MBU0791311.1 MAPEG family protein [Gammaproteobacteria bacterium]|tara:strand:- start:105 stop:509 length:405 start_codon:yes stop_codon:yes gene_type:complete